MGAIVQPFPWNGKQFNPAIPLDISTVEAAIVAQLQGYAAAKGAPLNQVEIAHFPENPETYRLTHRVGAVLVRFQGCEYGEVLDTEEIIQERTDEWNISVLMRDLGWSYGGQPSGPSVGAYQVLEAIRNALSGFIVQGYRKMYPAREEHEGRDREGGVWYYFARYRHVTMAIEDRSAPNYAPLSKVQARDTRGITAIGVAPADYTFDESDQITLPNQNVSAVTVTDQAGDTTYSLGTDYLVDGMNGIVTRLASGAIAAGATVSIGFNYSEIVTEIASGGSSPKYPTN